MAAALPIDLKCVQISGNDGTEVMAHVCPCPNPGSTVTGRDQFPELMFRDEFPDATMKHGSEAQEARANGACAFDAMPVVAPAFSCGNRVMAPALSINATNWSKNGHGTRNVRSP
jgi:hypothetical protein